MSRTQKRPRHNFDQWDEAVAALAPVKPFLKAQLGLSDDTIRQITKIPDFPKTSRIGGVLFASTSDLTAFIRVLERKITAGEDVDIWGRHDR